TKCTGPASGAWTSCPIATGITWTVTGTSLFLCTLVLSTGGSPPTLTSVTPSSTTITFQLSATAAAASGPYTYTISGCNGLASGATIVSTDAFTFAQPPTITGSTGVTNNLCSTSSNNLQNCPIWSGGATNWNLVGTNYYGSCSVT